MAAELRSTVEGRTMVLTISNPEHRNALGPEMYAAGVEALNIAETNPDVRCVVLTGEGETFCAGGNLQRLQANRQKPPEVQAQSIEQLHSWVEAIRTFPKPVIAAVEGPAAGAGFSLVFPALGVVAVKKLPQENQGSALATYSAFLDLSLGVTGPLAGILMAQAGIGAIYPGSALLVLVAMALVLRLLLRPSPQKTRADL